MFLLSQVFTILHQPDLIRVLTEAVLVGDLTLLCPTAQAIGDEATEDGDLEATTNDVIAHLRAAHHGKRAAKASPPGSRLAAFLRTSAECGCQVGTTEDTYATSASLDDDIERCTRDIRNFSGSNNRKVG